MLRVTLMQVSSIMFVFMFVIISIRVFDYGIWCATSEQLAVNFC